MIITAPTGLYVSILPGPNEPGNYTFTISTQDPPKSNANLIQLPYSEIVKSLPIPYFDKQQIRQFLGELVYDISDPGSSNSGTGLNEYEIGDILEFGLDDNNQSDTYEPNSIELRQDTKVVDYEKFGLTDDEYNQLVIESYNKIDLLTNSINEVGVQIKNNSNNLVSNQSNINDVNKLYINTVSIFGEKNPIAIKLNSKMQEYEREKVVLISEREILQSTLDQLKNELERIREVVR